MKIDIYRVLGFTKLTYQNYVTNFYNIWCDHISNKILVPAWELQKSTSLYNYFLNTWDKKVIEPFLLENIHYLEAGVKDPQTYFDLLQAHIVATNHFTDKYPSAITNAIKLQHYESLRQKQL